MTKQLSTEEISYIVDILKSGESLPEDLKYRLFPTIQKEYELVYAGKMRKEDILSNQDGIGPVPLQVEKVFNGERVAWPDGWRNMIVFGDNLQFLKTCYENRDEHISNKIKGKVKLIYIDPPFGTGDDYDGNNGQAAYSAKQKGAEFVEFIRKRLIVSKQLLMSEGWIFLRQGNQFGHHLKLVMDEVFGKHNFVNELIVNRVKKNVTNKGRRNIPNAVDHIYVYRNSELSVLHNVLKSLDKAKAGYWHGMDSPGIPGPRFLVIEGRTFHPPKGTHFKFPQDQADIKYAQGKLRINPSTDKLQYWVEEKDQANLDSNWTDIPGYTFTTGYPTENSEQLLERIIKASTEEGDLVLDFFGGSGTTAAVAEKMGRKWVTCDIGKFSFYTIQKRLLNIESSRDSLNPKTKYGKVAKSFVTFNTGHYDLEKIFQLEEAKYSQFVMDLFEISPTPGKKIGGISIHGERNDGFYCHIFPYWIHKEASVDEDYLNSLHESIGKKVGTRFYIISPVNYVDFISDYHQIEKVRYYFLKVPYHIIRELHKAQFKKFRQPQSQRNINELEDAIGFHFMRQPSVTSRINITDTTVQIKLSEFKSSLTEDSTGKDMGNFESLAMVLLDTAYNGTSFDMKEHYFAEDIIPKRKKAKNDQSEEILSDTDISSSLLSLQELTLPVIDKAKCGKNIMAIYVDIYGNEFKEIFELN